MQEYFSGIMDAWATPDSLPFGAKIKTTGHPCLGWPGPNPFPIPWPPITDKATQKRCVPLFSWSIARKTKSN